MDEPKDKNHLEVLSPPVAASSAPPVAASSAPPAAASSAPPAAASDTVSTDLQLLASLFDRSPHLLALADVNGVVLRASDSWRTLIGVNSKSLLGKSWSGITGFLNAQLPTPSEFSHIADVHMVMALKTSDKKHRWFAWQKTDLPTGMGQLWTGQELLPSSVSTAIPPEIENAVSSFNIRIDQLSEHGGSQIREVIEHMPGILFELISTEDGSFRFVYSSSNSKRLFGLTPEEVTRCEPSTLFLARDYPGLLIELFDSQQNGKSISWEGRLKSNDPAGYWIQVYATPMTESGGKTIWYGLMLDIHQQRIAEMSLELERAKAFGAAKMAALGEMTAGVAHEINNPLAVILGKAEQLGEAASTGEMNAKWIADGAEKIIRMSQRISKIIRGLRSFARDAENDPFEVKSLNQVIEDSIELCQARFRSNNVKLTVQHFEPDIQIECRAVQISQVILNLLNNAFDAIQEFDHKWVQIEASPHVGQDGKLSHVQISVTDCGSGISAEVVSHIMAPFFTTKPAGKGTGLGLSISKDIAETHSGKLFVNHAKQNTTFVIELPVAQPKEIKLAKTSAPLKQAA